MATMATTTATAAHVLPATDVLGFPLDEDKRRCARYKSLVASCEVSDRQWSAYREKRCRGERCLIRTRALVSLVSLHGLSETDRPRCWYTWSGAAVLRKNSKKTYEAILQDALDSQADGGADGKQIDLDLPRTFPEHPSFRDAGSDLWAPLERILIVASSHTTFGYCQGMNYLAAVVLLVMRSEQEAFWVFVALLRALGPYFERRDLRGLKSDLEALQTETSVRLPRAYSHVKSCGLSDFSLCVPKWLLCLFVGAVDAPLLLKVWDAFWCSRGDRRLFLRRVCLHLLRVNQAPLLEAETLGDVYQALSACGRTVTSAHAFLAGVAAAAADGRDSAAMASPPGSGRKRRQREEGRNGNGGGGGSAKKRAPEEAEARGTGLPSPRQQRQREEETPPMTPVSKTLQMWIQSGTPLMRMKTIARATVERRRTPRPRKGGRTATASRTRAKPAHGGGGGAATPEMIEMKEIARRLDWSFVGSFLEKTARGAPCRLFASGAENLNGARPAPTETNARNAAPTDVSMTTTIDPHQVAPSESMPQNSADADAKTPFGVEMIGADGAKEIKPYARKLSNGLHAVRGLTISLHNVGVEIEKNDGFNIFRSKKERTSKKVLQSVTAVIRSGEMYGLMGPSGAGKTTLLDVISHRLKHPAKRHGDVLYDSHRPTMSEVRRDASYVEQSDDVLSSMGHFTVFESVLFAAMCKLPHDKWSKEQKIERVHQVLKQMSLDQAKHTVVGNPGIGLRGISGGERKRVSISMGLLYNPRAIFLDEPTTGLDSAMASEVMHIVKSQLQGLGCTLVVTIHQPSPVIFDLLDQLILLKAGRIIYLGRGGMEPCKTFADLGYPYRQGYNIAEFLLETVTDKAATCDFASVYEESDQCQAQLGQAEDIWEEFIHQTKPGDALTPAQPLRRTPSCTLAQQAEQQNLMYYANTPLREVWVLLRFRVAIKWRMGWFIASKLAIPILVGGVYASFFNSLPKNFWGSFTTAGLLFVTVALAGFLSIAPLEDFKGEWPLVLRQRQDAYYRSSSYCLEKILQEIPYGLMGALGFGLITYFVIGLKMTPYAFFFYTLCSFTVNMVSTAIAFGVASNIHIDFLPQALCTVWNTLNILVSGFFLPKCQIPKWWSWLYWISYQQWTWSALMINQYGDQSGVEEAVRNGECEQSFDSGAKCSDGIGSLLNRLPMLFQSVGFTTKGNQCTAMNNFTLNMFNLGKGSHSNQWLCLLWAALSLPVFIALFYVGVARSTRSRQ